MICRQPGVTLRATAGTWDVNCGNISKQWGYAQAHEAAFSYVRRETASQ